MDTSKKQTPKFNKETWQHKKDNKSIDSDAELALALSASDDEFAHQQHLIHLKQQEDADAEYALQLSEEFSAEYASASASASTHDANPVSSDRYGDNNGDDHGNADDGS